MHRYIYKILFLAFISFHAIGQNRFNSGGQNFNEEANHQDNHENEAPKKSVPSIIKTWHLKEEGASFVPEELDTSLTFFHIYQPFNKKSISTTFTGNNGGAYLSNDFFVRNEHPDFYFYRSFDIYSLFPSGIQYFNTTTPYTMLEYCQSENKSSKNETIFNVFHSQNVNEKFNFGFIYDQTKSQGHYPKQENKFHYISLFTSYRSDHFISHGNIIFNRWTGQENGGVEPNQDLNGVDKTENIAVNITDAEANLRNNNFFVNNEYRLGKTIEKDSADYIVEEFIPRIGFIHEIEFSNNSRKFTKDDLEDNFFENMYIDSIQTNDSVRYNRLTNIFQIKFYEAPDRKYTFGKRVYIGNDQLWYKMPDSLNNYPQKQSNTFVGGGIYRNESKFWQWGANGRLYFAGYRTGQTELEGFIRKPVYIGKDTTSLKVEGSLKSLVPDYFEKWYYSNHFTWSNNDFKNINEVIIKARINSQKYKLSIGSNYALIGNYIYNDEDALPHQAGSELLILSLYLNKDFIHKNWVIRTQAFWQSANQKYVHLPSFSCFASLNYRTVISKVMFTQIGIDARYNTAFYADAYEPSTGRFYLQNTEKIGNYPFVDFHLNLKLKRTRFFFKLMNLTSDLMGNKYYTAPSYPLYRRTYRIGLSWSFYN